MDKSECSICDNTFDGESHRPRVLPCGHGYCTQCIEKCIYRGNKCCPVCKKEYTANSASDLPVCYFLEECLNQAAKKHVSYSILNIGSADMCPKHEGIPLYFHCITHDVKACHSCAVIDHPHTSCSLIPIGDELKKQSQIVSVQKQKQVLMDTEEDLKMLFQINVDYLVVKNNKKQNIEKEIELLLTKNEKINKEILEKEKSQKQITDAIQECQKNQKSFDSLEDKLKTATNIQNIGKECEMATDEILQSREWEETLRKELNVRKLTQDKYSVVERDGIRRSCLIFTEGGRMFIPNLSKKVQPTSYAKLIQESELGLTSTTTTVWMDLSACKCSLGRVFISVKGDRPHGRQFIMLALGTNGPTLKGVSFGGKYKFSIVVRNHVTESGSRSNTALLETQKKEYYETPSRGRLFPAGSDMTSFRIITRCMENSQWYGHFGDIIAGMEVIERAASDEYDITDITITECGIVLDY